MNNERSDVAMKEPRISVVLCTYNNEKTINLTIDSILGQTFTDYEFIIWNDGSNDRTEEIVRSYSDLRIRYFYHENVGPGRAAWLACEEAKGKYIARIDGDDIALPERLQKEVAYMENHPKCVLVSSAVIYFSDDETEVGRSFPYTWNVVLKKALKYNSPFAHPSCLFRTQAYKATKGYPAIRCCEDSVLFKLLSKQGDVHNISEPLLKYRVSAASVSHSLGKYATQLQLIADKLSKKSEYCKEDIEQFNNIYYKAKIEEHPQIRYYNDVWFKMFVLFSRIFPNKLSADFVTLIHNLMGAVLYFIKTRG